MQQLCCSNTELGHKIHASPIITVSVQHIPAPPNCCPVQSFWKESRIVSEPLSPESPCSLIWSSDCWSSPTTQIYKFKYHYHITHNFTGRNEKNGIVRKHVHFQDRCRQEAGGSRFTISQNEATTVGPCYTTDLDIQCSDDDLCYTNFYVKF
jgi:hypothetical protein